jgi:hypothetical protein
LIFVGLSVAVAIDWDRLDFVPGKQLRTVSINVEEQHAGRRVLNRNDMSVVTGKPVEARGK